MSIAVVHEKGHCNIASNVVRYNTATKTCSVYKYCNRFAWFNLLWTRSAQIQPMTMSWQANFGWVLVWNEIIQTYFGLDSLIKVVSVALSNTQKTSNGKSKVKKLSTYIMFFPLANRFIFNKLVQTFPTMVLEILIEVCRQTKGSVVWNE